jgi:hypothetical protein
VSCGQLEVTLLLLLQQAAEPSDCPGCEHASRAGASGHRGWHAVSGGQLERFRHLEVLRGELRAA